MRGFIITIDGEKATSIKSTGYGGCQVSTRRDTQMLDASSLNRLIRQGEILVEGPGLTNTFWLNMGLGFPKMQWIFKADFVKPNKIKRYGR